jgi:hypothetical protein
VPFCRTWKWEPFFLVVHTSERQEEEARAEDYFKRLCRDTCGRLALALEGRSHSVQTNPIRILMLFYALCTGSLNHTQGKEPRCVIKRGGGRHNAVKMAETLLSKDTLYSK